MKDVRIASPMFLDRGSDAVTLMSQPGDIVITAGPGGGDQTESLAPIHQQLANAVADIAAKGDRPFAVLGDCCQAIPMMAGTNTAATLSARAWMGALLPWAS